MDATTTRRRSQRLFLQIPVIVEVKMGGKTLFHEETQTIVVNAHGGLIEMSRCLDPGQTVTLQNVRTKEVAECKTKLVTPTGPQKFNAAFEFVHPNPDFWRISFPPDDWTRPES
jgi:hypothetical protein